MLLTFHFTSVKCAVLMVNFNESVNSADVKYKTFLDLITLPWCVLEFSLTDYNLYL